MAGRLKRKRGAQPSQSTSFDFSCDDVQNFTNPFVTSTSTVSSDGRRTYAGQVKTSWSKTSSKRQRVVSPVAGSAIEELEGFTFDFQVNEDAYLREPEESLPRKRYATSDDPLKEWLPLRDEYLQELLSTEGFAAAACEFCQNDKGDLYRCNDCYIRRIVCKSCCVTDHLNRPFHSIEVWNGRCFLPSSLKEAGLRVQLGHPPEARCPCPSSVESFVVLDINGIHEISLDFCSCDDAVKHGLPRQQLLRRCLFPATGEQPRTCATFALLRYFHLQNLQSKTTMYDFYSTLEKLSDNSGLKGLPKRYKEFIRMFREYRHLVSLKRGGCAHQCSGILGTTNGALSVRCPACPIPGVNLPGNWNELPPEKQYLYTLFLALDACFRLKRRDVSSFTKDPGLGIDWAYFTENEPFQKFLDTMSTCSGLSALDHANTKFSQGFAATGVCLGVCARHEIVQRNGAVDLQVGERYVNMDYCLGSMLRHHDPKLKKLISYDIACQWSKSLLSRLKALPPLVQLTIASEAIRFAVPKLHIHGHTKACQSTYSLNYLPGVGRTDGEGIERPWASIGATSTSTRAMGPGARAETLNDHWGHWNWQKILGLGVLLSRRMKTALSEREIQSTSFNAFSDVEGEERSRWKAAVESYEHDSSCPNPYVCAPEGLSETDLRDLIADEDARNALTDMAPLDDVSPSAFLIEGLNVEESQRNILAQKKNDSGNFNLDEARRKLSQKIAHFRSVQAVYMPGAFSVLQHRTVPPGEAPEDVPLLLPSSLTVEERSTMCVIDLAPLEYRLRDAQCRASLESLRNLLFIKSRLVSYKHRHVRHQHANTRTRALINRNEEKVKEQVCKYQAAWTALQALPSSPSEGKWPQLKNEDIRCMDDPDSLNKRHTRRALRTEHDQDHSIAATEDLSVMVVAKEGYQTSSWIWRDCVKIGGTGLDKGMNEALRMAWVKAWARYRRWSEEVNLLKEEMRRVLVTLRFQARTWDDRASTATDAGGIHCGLSAYAHRQAHVLKNLANVFEKAWTSGELLQHDSNNDDGDDTEMGEEDDDDEDDVEDDVDGGNSDLSSTSNGGEAHGYEEEMGRILD